MLFSDSLAQQDNDVIGLANDTVIVGTVAYVIYRARQIEDLGNRVANLLLGRSVHVQAFDGIVILIYGESATIATRIKLRASSIKALPFIQKAATATAL